MPGLERMNPDTPCQPDGQHHPHLYICNDPEDDCWDDLGDGHGYLPYHAQECCVCRGTWPCETKRIHIAERRAKHETRKDAETLFQESLKAFDSYKEKDGG
jgi:hypothetical protein